MLIAVNKAPSDARFSVEFVVTSPTAEELVTLLDSLGTDVANGCVKVLEVCWSGCRLILSGVL